MNSYQNFLASKQRSVKPSGFEVTEEQVNPLLFKFQNACVRWAVRLGKAAFFEECGLGKTFQEIEFARLVTEHTGGKAIILTPLAVAPQTIEESGKLQAYWQAAMKVYPAVKYCKDQSEVGDSSIIVTNYERLDKFNTEEFVCVVLDESSILKNFMGKTKQALFAAFESTPYKLCGTATPAPNDHLELGNHAAFLDVMAANEMISRWFINDAMEAGNYRLKDHAAKDFWRWLTSWAVCLSEPRDLGEEYHLEQFKLPPLNMHEYRLSANAQSIERAWSEGRLIPDDSPSSTGMHKVKRESLADRIEQARLIVDMIAPNEPILIWCDTDYEQDALVKLFPDALEVRGSQPNDVKEKRLMAFAHGENRMLITKPSIAGMGMNFQICSHQILVGVTYSFEKFYQAIRRSWRFGQVKPVEVYVIYAETEGNILVTLKNKQEQFKMMQSEMNIAMHEHGLFRDGKRLSLTIPDSQVFKGNDYTLILGDSIEQIKAIPDNSIDLGIHSPPFANLYIYSDSEADMGNSADDDEFFVHYQFLIKDLLRTTKPGRLCVIHCKDLPSYMNRDGAAGLIDFPGRIIRAFEEATLDNEPATKWQYHSRVTIWKDPVIEMQRTKNHGLLHKNFTSTADACRQGMADYLLVFRKWPLGETHEPVTQYRVPGDYVGTEPPVVFGDVNKLSESDRRAYSINVWQRYASPVWSDIDQTNVLNFKLGKGHSDERHICPLQLDVIERCVDLWSNKGEVVFTPFMGIGSEVYSALKMGRKGIGIELKESYWKQAIKFCKEMEASKAQKTLFDLLPEA